MDSMHNADLKTSIKMMWNKQKCCSDVAKENNFFQFMTYIYITFVKLTITDMEVLYDPEAKNKTILNDIINWVFIFDCVFTFC